MQKSIHRLGANHDSSIYMGYYGDKTWTEWLVRKLYASKTDTEPRSCGEWPYHLDDAIATMTNQRMTNAADWLTWWETNKNKSQCEWIRQGFAQRGLLLQQPLTTNNIIELLRLANRSTNSMVMANKTSSDLASALRYNALRWLRDSGFRAKDFDLTGFADPDRQELTAALIAYSEWYGAHQADPERLQITGTTSDYSLRDAAFLSPKFRWPLYIAISALALGGWRLLRKTR